MARSLAALHGAYGIVVMALSGAMLFFVTWSPESVGGCCGGSFVGLFQMLFGAVFLLAVPQFFAARSYLKGKRRGASSMVWLSALNGLINLATVALVSRGGGGAWALCWLPFLIVNAATLLVFRRESSPGAQPRNSPA